ncbi:hypothetical protein FSP39_017137 [Pinctada imbricata]|uniref:NADP-dependent oxidoreductase domain-containing protein n=1 Tax=Pinctada imbricata TaxID=66713 RepID=A0AA89BL03_PINIB|nr:hypothetical protein FSP39_017137 [Pinctada imbricata]
MTLKATSLASKIVLNDGVEMPMFGLGLYMSASGQGKAAEKAVIHAVQNNYRLLDTAQFYGNEADVGRAVKKSGVDRKDLFIVTKVWENGEARCKEVFNESMKKLDLGYIDLYLIHSPSAGKNVETYKTLLDFKSKGLIRSVGVSNYGVQHLEGLKDAGLLTPSVNQIELHPWQQKKHIVKYCRENGIAVMGYSPMAKGQKLKDPTLGKIAQKYNKTPAQVMIRWSVQMGFITIPKSVNLDRIIENADVFDWSIDEEDMTILSAYEIQSVLCRLWQADACYHPEESDPKIEENMQVVGALSALKRFGQSYIYVMESSRHSQSESSS